MSDARTAMEQLRTALEDAEVLTRPAALTDTAIDRITDLAHTAHDALEAERTRLTAAQETADRIAAQVGDWDGGQSPRLMVAVIDPETNTRLRTTFVTVRPAT